MMRWRAFSGFSPGKLLAIAVAGVLAALSAAAGCSYDPQIDDGTLKCSSAGTCPDGYSCRANLCYANGRPNGGSGGSGGNVPPAGVSSYLGSWTLGFTSTVTTNCPGSAPRTETLSSVTNPSVMTITPAPTGGADILSNWLCILELRVDATGAHLTDATPSCSDAGPDATITLQTWTATQFDIVANTGQTAMHTARYTRQDDMANGTTVRCMQVVTAPLTKN